MIFISRFVKEKMLFLIFDDRKDQTFVDDR